MVGKSNRHHLSQVLQNNITSHKIYGLCVPPEMMYGEGYTITSVIFMSKRHNLHLLVRKQ